MLLMLDNYDSFTYNLVQYCAQLGQEIIIKRNDEISVAEIAALGVNYIIIGPGPCAPQQAGISLAVIRNFAGKIPILGVCLGHQAIGEAFGGKTVRAQELKHGKNSWVYHQGQGVFAGINNPVNCTRYHSLVIDRDTCPPCLDITARTEDGDIMGVRHKELAVEGVQFHPEALLTEGGRQMLANFLTQNGDK